MNSCPYCDEACSSSSTGEPVCGPSAASCLDAPQCKDDGACQVLTVGHSTRAIEEFVDLLLAHGVTQLVDVRTVPRSRHNPQFNIETLPDRLAVAAIGYTHAAGLGGFRRTTADSPNTGWRNLSFRGYADYMQRAEFRESLGSLIKSAQQDRVALMCAEAVPWRCHRSLIADALVVHGMTCCEIVSLTRLQPHQLTAFAHVSGQHISYPPESVSPTGRT